MASIANLVVLFTDLVGSTELEYRLSRNDADSLRDSHFGSLRQAITSSGGTEVKSTGDGLMVVFPSATAALDCAVAIQQAIERHNRRAQQPLYVRVGMSSGDLTVASNDYFGDCAVEAARLCAAAGGGQILVADVVKTLASRGGHEFTTKLQLDLKGIPEPVVAWELTVPPVATVGVAIIEDHPLYLQGLMQTVEATPGLDLVAAVGTLADMENIGYHGVDVALLDLHLPDGSGGEAVSRVKAHGLAVLVVSASDDRQSVVDAIAAGANGYLPKSASAEEIVTATSSVASGGSYVSPVLAAFLLRANRDEQSGPTALTSREREILSLLAEGETDAEIAERLYISISTVRSHLDRIRDKTGRRRRADLTRLVLEDKWPQS
jgi:DNA-binding NarL/FixJ family response regulator/class 3 adenylate cyclase